MDSTFRATYPTKANIVLAERYGVSTVTIARWAGRLGLKKAPEYLAQVQRERMLGKRRSEETRTKIAAKAVGRVVSEEAKAKVRATKERNGSVPRGEKHVAWKGGRPWQRFKDPAYIAWRKGVLERDGYRCQDCGRQCRRYERGLAAHHLQSYAEHPELRLVLANGITLCRECHMERHGRTPAAKHPVPCACGCGTLIAPVDPYGRPRSYVNHHGARGKAKPDSLKQKLSRERSGVPLRPEHCASIRDGLRKTEKRVGRPPKST